MPARVSDHRNGTVSLVSVLVSFAPVQRRSPPTLLPGPPQARTPLSPTEPADEDLESVLGATPHEFESRILRQCLTGHYVEGPYRPRWGPSSRPSQLATEAPPERPSPPPPSRSGPAPERIPDLIGDLLQERARHVHVPSAHPGRATRLPAHDHVNDHVRDSQQQEDGAGRVRSVIRPSVPYSRVLQQLLPPMEISSRSEQSTGRPGEDVSRAIAVATPSSCPTVTPV